ncbi:MAG: hypothetical protein LC775_13305, partial [Acidobacteria bacterium]|nr:hypothetical protein [Acidobacteriota bacterium]
RRVDPAVADLAQAPYSRLLRQGVCDPSQGLRFGNRGEAVALFLEGYARRPRPAGDVLVAVEDDLGPEGRMNGGVTPYAREADQLKASCNYGAQNGR